MHAENTDVVAVAVKRDFLFPNYLSVWEVVGGGPITGTCSRAPGASGKLLVSSRIKYIE